MTDVPPPLRVIDGVTNHFGISRRALYRRLDEMSIANWAPVPAQHLRNRPL
jgi:hypothetical protein